MTKTSLAGRARAGATTLSAIAIAAMRRAGFVGAARRLGLSRVLNNQPVGDRLRALLRRDAEAASSDLAVKVAEGLRSGVGANRHEALRLERACQQAGLLHSAELILRQGLDYDPAGPELRMRLLELLALRKKHEEVIELWDGRTDADRRRCRPVTYARVARVMRDLGVTERAHSTLEEGQERWPKDHMIRDEIQKTRPLRIRWDKALRQAGDAPHTTTGQVGRVDDLGFLMGDPWPLTGLVEPSGGRRVALRINDVTVSATTATCSTADNVGHFSLRCDEVLQFLGDGDVISIARDSHVLQYGDGIARWTLTVGHPSRSMELVRLINTGHVFTKFGALRPCHTEESKAIALDLFGDVSAILKDAFGYQAYPFYGNLLGAIRERDFIAHDVGGFDMAYVSRHNDPGAVRAEFIDVCGVLVRRGYFLRVEPWSTYVRRTYRSRVHVDLNFAWFSDDELHVSGGSRHRPARGSREFLRPRTSLIGDQTLPVPGNAEDVLDQLYGDTWQTPDQGFDFRDGLTRDPELLLSREELANLEALDPDRVQVRPDGE